MSSFKMPSLILPVVKQVREMFPELSGTDHYRPATLGTDDPPAFVAELALLITAQMRREETAVGVHQDGVVCQVRLWPRRRPGSGTHLSSYKTELLDHLMKCGWEQTELIDLDEWWAGDCWRIRSIQQCWGLELTLSFLVDPHWEGAHTGEKPPVWAVIATSELPETWNVPDPIATLSMRTHKFSSKVEEFVASLNRYREEQ